MVDPARATFITPSFPTGREGDPPAYLRRDFYLTDPPRTATLRVTALGVVETHLNGATVGNEILTPGWTSYRNRLAVTSFDVTDKLTIGQNTVGAIVAEGWALGRLGWDNRRNHYADRVALFLELLLEYADRTEIITSDSDFRANRGAIQVSSIYDGEEHDARLEPAGWDRNGYDDSSWSSVESLEWPTDALFEPTYPPIRRISELKPLAIFTTPSGKTVADFGQNITGRIRIRVLGDKGTTITLRHAEVMTGGEIDTETLRTAKATDRYTLDGSGIQDWEPRFTFHGFRYVEVDGWPGELSTDSLRAIVLHTDMERTGWLETSDPLLNQLHSNAVWSMRGNFVGVPTDCPQRDERLGWTGDLNAFAPSAAFLYDVRGILGSWLDDLAAEQLTKGFVPWVVPDVLATPSSPTALWSDVAVNLPWILYEEYGDADILVRAYGSMSTFVRQVADLLDENGLWGKGFQYGDWLDPDAPIDNPAGGKTDAHLVAAAYFCRTTRQMADTAHLLGRTSDIEEFTELANRVQQAFRNEYVTPAGRVASETATAYSLAIVFDLLSPEQRKTAGGRLADLVARSGYRISTGFAGTPLVADALSSTGHLDKAYMILTEKQCPSFLYPVTMGATTIWERWDSIRPDGTINPSGMTSLNHYALGAVVDWMHRTIGGLTSTSPGYQTIRIAPQPGAGLTHATLRHRTRMGEITITWAIEHTQAMLEVVIPPGTTAEVVPPLHPDCHTETVTEGQHNWSYSLSEPYGSRPAFDFDTPLAELAKDSHTWRLLTAVFETHLPGIPIDGTAPEAAAMGLAMMLEYIPGASEQLTEDLRAALAASALGAQS
ncbi:alpha-L-rhamnosidase (plasmid) [Rhodococcus erythropolis R138]|uniref:alpha-L-rhamnosidase n=1 Tax=Rhodococcus erythropolis TaxID=1833 RepID=UPI0004A8774C|nr:alpha-L-rhamnosidase [Rhodococcus erythropolis]ALU73578.1 alpha-L-rhamnosidase [Rhodococcus erythropolis R138]